VTVRALQKHAEHTIPSDDAALVVLAYVYVLVSLVELELEAHSRERNGWRHLLKQRGNGVMPSSSRTVAYVTVILNRYETEDRRRGSTWTNVTTVTVAVNCIAWLYGTVCTVLFSVQYVVL
jgi:hypothetical protein